jgi:hypothetical protein
MQTFRGRTFRSRRLYHSRLLSIRLLSECSRSEDHARDGQACRTEFRELYKNSFRQSETSAPVHYNSGGDKDVDQIWRSPLSQMCAEKSDGSIPGDSGLLRIEGSKKVFFVQEGVAGRIVIDLRFCVGGC